MAGSTLGAFVMTLVCFPVLPSLKISAKKIFFFFLLCFSEIGQVESCNLRICPLLHWGFYTPGRYPFFLPLSLLFTQKISAPITGTK